MSDSFLIPGTVALQAPLSMEFPRQELWSGLQFPSPGDLPDSGIEPTSPALAHRFFTTEPPEKPSIPEQQEIEASWKRWHCELSLGGMGKISGD